MPPRKRRNTQMLHMKAAPTKSKSSCSSTATPNHPKYSEPSEPIAENRSEENERAFSPEPSDDSSSKSESQMSEGNAEQSQKPALKKPKTYTNLTIDQQEAMVEWLKTHEVHYNKKLESYKDTKKRAFLWQQQAEVIGVDVEMLKIWYNSLRTRYTKLKKMKSGNGAPEHSERDQWVLNNFSFLAPFTYEVKKRTLISLKSKLPPPTTTDTTPDPMDEEDIISPSRHISQRSDNQQHLKSSTTTASVNTSSSSTPKPSDLFSSAISSRIDQFMEMQNCLMQKMVRPNTDRMKEVFVDYIRETVYEIHPNLWEDMHRDVMKTVLMYKDKDNEQKRIQQHTATATSEPVMSSDGWQPPPHMWPSSVQNLVSVWGSTKSAWVNQQFPQHQHFSQQQQSQQLSTISHQQHSQHVFQPQSQTSSMQQQQQPNTSFSTEPTTLLVLPPPDDEQQDDH